jgi:hypothetical protein
VSSPIKNKSVVPIARSNAFIFVLFSIDAEAFFEESGGRHMYTVEPPVLVSRKISAESIFRSASKSETNPKFVVTLARHDAVRFLLWWLFRHRRLRSRQRGSSPKTRAACVRWLISAAGCCFVFIRTTRFAQGELQQAFRLRCRAFQTAAFRSFCRSNEVSPPMRSTSRYRSKCP